MSAQPEPQPIRAFIDRWTKSAAAERANYALFLTELCDVLAVPRPEPTKADDAHNAYVFERAVTFYNADGTTSPGRIDLYKRGCFVLEAKQGSEQATQEAFALSDKPKKLRRGTAVRGTQGWDDAMVTARGQAEQYAKALPESEGWPPFLMVVDVGHSFELFADFSGIGKRYTHFPNVTSYRIPLADLEKEEVRDRLRCVWTDPASLDPSRRSAKVTREVAAKLAELAKSLEASGHEAQAVATFLMRCLFTMFAEDVELLPRESFTRMLKSLRGKVANFAPMAEELWEAMRTGKKFSSIIEGQVLHFNGGLFESAGAIPLTDDQLELLIDAAEKTWSEVEPAIFGTLLERALDSRERHKLGAHFTPRAYVERLVIPTVIEPLREEWEAVQVAAITLARQGHRKEAIAEVRAFHHKLCETKVLDPACGSGNFLYVTLEHLKRLEGEINDLAISFGEMQGVFQEAGYAVDPHQLLGIEVNPRAAAIADLVLWIGYLQWHFRTRGHTAPAEPILKAFHNIDCRDAVLAYDGKEPVLDAEGRPVTRWDGHTTKKHPVTGEDVPEETARVPVYRYLNPRKAEWPKADYVVGNPPFVGASRMREALGDGYCEALRSAHPDVSESSDFVMYWWNHAGHLARARQITQFGLITTNSLRQPLNRRVVQAYLASDPALSIRFAIPDHPWVDSADGADVRIAMTVASLGDQFGTLKKIRTEEAGPSDVPDLAFEEAKGRIHADLSIGADVMGARVLLANCGLSSPGMKLHGAGFIVTREEAESLGLGTTQGLEKHIREYRNGRDITSFPRHVMVIDLFGLEEEELSAKFPRVYQWILDRVKPERDQNNRASYRTRWWIFGEPRKELRPAIKNLDRYIVTVETARHRLFQFLDKTILPDNKLIVIALDDPFVWGVLSSKVHVAWALATGSWLGVGNDPVYVKTTCFEKFPFPISKEPTRSRVSQLAEAIDAHRKRQQGQHPKLGLTDMYNVLEKLRSGEPLTEKEKVIHEQGLVSVLKQLHDELDRAVFEAYGWPADLTDEQILERLVALNAERAAEEERGLIRWLRPEFQNAQGAPAISQAELDLPESAPAAPLAAAKAKKTPWPKTLPEQAHAVRSALSSRATPTTAADLATHFTRAKADRIEELLETLASLGQAREVEEGKFVA